MDVQRILLNEKINPSPSSLPLTSFLTIAGCLSLSLRFLICEMGPCVLFLEFLDWQDHVLAHP